MWLTALHPLRSSLTWAGPGLAVGAGVGAILATGAGFWAKGAGTCLWLVGGAVTLRLMW